MKELESKLNNPRIDNLFTDYYDTLVHRTVHPNQVLRIWSKLMIRELGLDIEIDQLYFTFKESILYLVEKLDTDRNELPYQAIKEEVFRRVNTIALIDDGTKAVFFEIFEKVHLKAEKSVQYVNEDTLSVIRQFKAKGGRVYVLSDFYCPSTLFVELLKHHGIIDLFDGVYSSSTLGKSKHTGTVYKALLKKLHLEPSTSIMIGDNERSDSINAEKAGLNSFVLPHKKHLRRNKAKAIGKDGRKIRDLINSVYKICSKKDKLPYTEYVLFYHFFTERLYTHCKANGIDSLFFLSREGLFLKRIFDSYQKFHLISEKEAIRTHYLKVSRQASLQIALQPIDDEPFSYLRRKYKSMSINELLGFFNFNNDLKASITEGLSIDCDELHQDFFDSDNYQQLQKNQAFREAYEAHRQTNKRTFNTYISSFGEPIESKGIHVVDIGWGGTMQEAIYNFFNGKIKVFGYYLGLNLIYNPNEDTKRHGFIFSILPYMNYDFHILHANTQLYEQFAGANHGCCVAYDDSKEGYTIEHHEENEKWLYDNYIGEHQEQMFEIHKFLMQHLEPICYSNDIISKALVNFALKLGTLQNMRKIRFLETLNSGYYQNISTKKTGIDYEIPKNLISIKEFLKFLMKPEDYFRYVVKLKHKLFKTNKLIAGIIPMRLVLWYYQFNRFVRYKILKRNILLRFNYFR
jgi:FMN phosphatase YigB (HAD superfamily)